MNDDRRLEEQLNTASSEQEFTLEDIMQEFGSAAQASPAAEPEEAVRLWQPKTQDPDPLIEMNEPREEPLRPRAEEPPREEEDPGEEDEEETPFSPRLLRLLPRRGGKRLLHRWEEEEEPEEVSFFEEEPEPKTPAEAAEEYRGPVRRLRGQAIAAWVLMALSAAALVLVAAPWPFADFLTVPLCNMITLGILLCHCLVSAGMLGRGVLSAVGGKITVPGLLLLTAAVTVLRGFMTLWDVHVS